ncbi:MAG: phosphoribosylaminoimidazolesuccinocarboxamide synthase [Gammaproteobacteria bacterium]|jgi:phosphoribosylaminoimidazole-succinocarboxamide synthase
MEKQKLLAQGKAKSMYETDSESVLLMEFRDDASAFDGKKMSALNNKGKVNNQFNAFILDLLAKEGIETHFIETISTHESLVKKLDMFPIECVVRNRATGSLCRRLGVEDGLILDPPLFEFFLKDDALGDPLINENHILSFKWASQSDIDEMKRLTFQVNEILRELFDKANLILVDYKLEFGKFEGRVLLGDEFTPDGCRLWDKDTLEKLDKDRFRQDLGDVIESYQEVANRLGIEINLD